MDAMTPWTSIRVRGKISLATQEPWIIQGTVRHNILFGGESDLVDETRYQRCLQNACLVEDLLQFPNGDQTVIGEKGDTLSGGQMKRINLARALYQNADIYLFDDILASLDIKVSTEIFERCLQHDLKDKTVLYFSSSFNHIKKFDRIMQIRNGRLSDRIDYENYKKELEENVSDDLEEVTLLRSAALSHYYSYLNFFVAKIKFQDEKSEIEKSDILLPRLNDYTEEQLRQAFRPDSDKSLGLLQQEDRDEGSVHWRNFLDLINYFGGLPFSIFFLGGAFFF